MDLSEPVQLEINVKLPNGKHETRRVACDREDPLLVFFEKAFRVKFKEDALGPQVVEIEGQRSSFYHFVLIDKSTGKKYMPYAEDIGGKRIYLDLRHILFSPKLSQSMAVEVFMVYDHRDIANSVTTRYDREHAWFKLDEFTSEDLRVGDLSRMMKKHYIGNLGEDCRFHFLQLRARMLLETSDRPAVPSPVFSFDGKTFSFSLPGREMQMEPPIAEPEKHGEPELAARQEINLAPNIAVNAHEWEEKMPVLAESHFQASKMDGQEQLQMNYYQSAIAEISKAATRHGIARIAQKKGHHKAAEMQNDEKSSSAPSGKNSESRNWDKHKRKKKFAPVPFSAISSFKAVIFDLDGVIVDSEMVHPRTFELALAKYGIKIDNTHWKRAYTGIGSYAIFDDLVKKHGINEDARELVKKRNEIYMDEITKNKLPVIEGFADVHRLLVKKGILEAVASGGHINHVEESMRSVGLKNMPFVAIEQVKEGKPSPEIFLKAAKKLGVKPAECIVFEDSLSGMEAAARAGMPCVALSTTMKEVELRGKAALIVRNYKSKKLKRLLAMLLARREKAVQAKEKPAPKRSQAKRKKK